MDYNPQKNDNSGTISRTVLVGLAVPQPIERDNLVINIAPPIAYAQDKDIYFLLARNPKTEKLEYIKLGGIVENALRKRDPQFGLWNTEEISLPQDIPIIQGIYFCDNLEELVRRETERRAVYDNSHFVLRGKQPELYESHLNLGFGDYHELLELLGNWTEIVKPLFDTHHLARRVSQTLKI